MDHDIDKSLQLHLSIHQVLLKPDFSKTSYWFAETGFLPVIKRPLSYDYRGIGVHKGANLIAELEYSFFSKLAYNIYSRS